MDPTPRRALAVLAAAVVVGAGAYATLAADAKVGRLAPDFTLKDSKGVDRSLASFAGKPVVLEWHNKDCPYVKKHYASGNMQKLQKSYTAKGVVWLAILSSAEGKQGYATGEQAEKDMAAAGAAPTHVLLDPSGAAGRLYGAKTTPHMYVVDGGGVLRYNGAIDSNSSSDPAVIPESDNYVAAALDAVLGGKKVAKPVTRPYGCSVKYKS